MQESLDVLFQGLRRIWENVRPDAIRFALPIVTRRGEVEKLRRRIETLHGYCHRWEAANVSAWRFLGLDPLNPASWGGENVSCDWPLYTLNRAAARQWLEMGAHRVVLSPEDGRVNLRSLLAEFGERAVVVVYQDTPLFISQACLFASGSGRCSGLPTCRQEPKRLTSAFGDELVALREGCRTVVTRKEPFSLVSRLEELLGMGARCFRVDLSYGSYTPHDLAWLWRGLREGKGPSGSIGNYERGLA